MKKNNSGFRNMKGVTGIFLLIFSQTGGLIYAQSTNALDAGWPRQFTRHGDTLLFYQPQINDWKEYKNLIGDIAFSLSPKGGKEVHGVASFDCGTMVDKESHTAYLRDIHFTSVRFPGLEQAEHEKDEAIFRKMTPKGGSPVAIDRIMADLNENKKCSITTVPVKNDPPPIFYSTTPAVLLMVEGEPVMAPISKTGLQFIVNTNWDLFFEKSKKDYFLLVEKNWLTTKELKGPWIYTKTLPKDLSKLPSGENFDEVKKAIPPQSNGGPVPEIIFSDKPAELILVKEQPVYSSISGTNLLFVSNTEKDLFLDNQTKDFYILLSGRWFSTKDLKGPWTYAGDHLPADFARIPENSPKASVLASVPGTIEASDAILLAQIPTTAIVNKKEAESKVKVSYDGSPAFKPIEGTSLAYATNTQYKVIKYGDLYYLCFQAVWFMSTTPKGPWKTADSVPKEIYSIPPSSPVYNVTYVTQTPVNETTVQSDAAAGYFGAFLIGVGIGACLAYGTGWYYPPYTFWGPGMLYPVYRPWPYTYGAGYLYNPWTGGFAGGSRIYGPYAAAGTSAWYNPATGRYGRSASVQGWYGGRTVAHSYNPWTGGYAATSQGHNPYAQWGSSVAKRGGQWAQTGHITTANGTTAGYRTSTGQHGVIHSGDNGVIAKGSNGVFAGHDGNVYHRDTNGDWKSFNNQNGRWEQSVGGSESTRKELDGVASSRLRGQTQTERFQNHFNGGGRMGGLRRR